MTQTPMFKTLISLAVIIPVLIAFGITFTSYNTWADDEMPAAWTACTIDQDCTLTHTKCCDYNIPINIKFLSEFRDRHPLPKECALMKCAIGILPTRCVQGICTVINNFDKGLLK